MERRIETVISAVDEYSAVMNRYNNALGQTEGAIASAGQASNKLSRQFDGLTSGLDWAAAGVRRFKSVLEGVAFGAVIGVVSALTYKFIEQYRETARTQEEMEKLNTTVFSQAEKWKLLPGPMNEVSKGLVDIYNHQLAVWKLDNLGKGDAIQKEMALLNKGIEMRETAMLKMSAINEKTGQFVGGELALKVLETHNRDIVEGRLRVAELSQEYKTWTTGMQFTEQSVKSINNAMADIKAPDLFGGFTEGSLSSLVMGSLKVPEDQINLAGVEFGKNLTAAMKAGVKTAMQEDGLTFSMGPLTTTESGDNTAYFAWLDERYQTELAYEEMLLSANLAYSDQRIAMERNLQNTILSLKFGAANQGIALLSLVGQKSKALMLAALVAQKALAIAQVWIQTQVASSAALAPPPLGLGPVFGAPLAASVQLWGKIQMGLIAATGLAEAAMGGGGSPASMSGVGGGGGVGALPITAPTRTEQQAPISVTLIVNTLDGKDVNWARVMEDNILPTMEKISGDGNRPINIRVAQA